MSIPAAASTRPAWVDADALAGLLQASGLFDPALSRAAASIAGGFPAETAGNLFVECELAEHAVPSGFGVGFPWGFYDHCVATDHAFVSTAAGRAVASAMAADPFAADPAAHLSLLGDDDPDWIEYDIAHGRIDATPFVFFRPPSRFGRIATREQARLFCASLAPAGPVDAFAALLEVLAGLGPFGMYRIGRARQRGEGWWRAIVSNLQQEQVVAALRGSGASGFELPLDGASALYAGRADVPGSRFALSIDVQDGRITAIDVECPYLFRIGDVAIRRAAFASFLDAMRRQAIVREPAAAWLGRQCSRQVAAAGAAMRVRVHHLKFRLLGSPQLRVKAYLHLDMTGAADRAEP